MLFAYKALGRDGIVSGRIEAANAVAARDALLSERLTPVSIKRALPGFGANPDHLNASLAAAFAADIARFLRSGLSLVQALRVIEQTAGSSQTAALAARTRGDLLSGQSLSQSLERLKGDTGRLLHSLARAGEATGRLAEILEGGARGLQSTSALQRRLTTLALYPAFVAGMAVLAVMMFAFGVLPALEPAFASVTSELPVAMQWVLAAGEILRFSAPFIGGVFLAGVAVVAVSDRARAVLMRGIHRVLLSRLGGGVLQDAVFSGFAQRLAIGVSAGIPLASAFRVSAAAVGVKDVREPLLEQEQSLRDGAKLSVALRNVRHTPELILSLIAVGEQSQDLGRVLSEAAVILGVRAQEKSERTLSLLTPMIVMIIGALVGGIVLVVFQGLISISEVVAL